MRTNLSIRFPGFLLLFAVFSIFFSSCKKIDTNAEAISGVKNRFFELPSDANPLIKRVVANLKEQEAQHPFVEHFVKYEGYPIWKNAEISVNHNVAHREGETDTLVIIPIVPDSGLYVRSLLGVRITYEMLYKIYRRQSYATYGFDTDHSRQSPNANDVVAKIMELEKKLFGGNAYIINDNRLFDVWPSSSVKPDQFLIKNAKAASNEVPTYEMGGNGPCNLYAVYIGSELQFYYTTGNCGMPSMEGGLDGGIGWGPAPTGGGGEDPAPPLPPCDPNPGFERLVINFDGLYEGPCTPPIPIPPGEDINPENPGIYFPFEFDLTAPDINLGNYFHCFTQIPDAGASYSVTIYADIPANDQPNELISGNAPGHAFISMTKSNGSQSITQTFGFYPLIGPLSLSHAPVNSNVKDNGLHTADASLTMSNISATNFQTLITTAISYASHNYDLNDNNCANFALDIFNSIRPTPLNVPDWEVVVINPLFPYNTITTNYGKTPNGIYKTLTQTPGSVIGVMSGPSSHGSCP